METIYHPLANRRKNGEVLKTPKTPGLRPCDIAKNGISMVTEKKRHSKNFMLRLWNIAYPLQNEWC